MAQGAGLNKSYRSDIFDDFIGRKYIAVHSLEVKEGRLVRNIEAVTDGIFYHSHLEALIGSGAQDCRPHASTGRTSDDDESVDLLIQQHGEEGCLAEPAMLLSLDEEVSRLRCDIRLDLRLHRAWP